MGLAASQARLLSLTARMHDIEYKAQKLEAQKLQMANKSQQVYVEYEDALNRTKVQYKTIGADGSASFKDATLKDLVVATGEGKADYIAHNISTNQMYCTQAQISAFVTASTATNPTTSTAVGSAAVKYALNAAGNYVNSEGKEIKGADGNAIPSTQPAPEGAVLESVDTVSVTDTNYAAQKFAEIMGWAGSASLQALYNEMLDCVNAHDGDATKAFIAVDGSDNSKFAPDADVANQFNNPVYLTNMLQEGFIVLHKMTGNNVTAAAEEINIATDTALQEVSDELDLKKAEARYEADMAKINAKDKKFDTDIAALEQERNAIKTEIDTLKTVAKDNVERTFKLFS